MLASVVAQVTTTTAPDPGSAASRAVEGCQEGGGFLCERVLDWTGSATLADWTAFLLDKPLRILLVVVLAAICNHLARRAIRRITGTIVGAAGPEGRAASLLLSPSSVDRTSQRAETLGTVMRSVSSVVIWGIAFLLVLSELGVDLAPLLAGAGIAGVALGFGAQSLVKDVLTGFFMLFEDQYGVGDVVDVGEAAGTVERVGLRSTTVRDINGTLWHVPNGEIVRVGNKSQLWSRAVLDVDVEYGADLERAASVILDAARDLCGRSEFADAVREEPELLGVERLAPDGVTIRLTVKTEPAQQYRVERALRVAIKDALDRSGIEIPFPQRTVWLRADTGSAELAGGEPAPT